MPSIRSPPLQAEDPGEDKVVVGAGVWPRWCFSLACQQLLVQFVSDRYAESLHSHAWPIAEDNVRHAGRSLRLDGLKAYRSLDRRSVRAVTGFRAIGSNVACWRRPGREARVACTPTDSSAGNTLPDEKVLMECYVVRIYRRSEPPAAEPVGVVELVDSKQRIRFQSFSELVGILRVCPPLRPRGTRRPRAAAAKRRPD